MAKRLETWVETDVQSLEEKSISWWSQFHSFRHPLCPTHSDMIYFFSPVDDLIGLQRTDDVDFFTFGLKQDEAAAQGSRSHAAVSIPKAKGGEITWNLKSSSR